MHYKLLASATAAASECRISIPEQQASNTAIRIIRIYNQHEQMIHRVEVASYSMSALAFSLGFLMLHSQCEFDVDQALVLNATGICALNAASSHATLRHNDSLSNKLDHLTLVPTLLYLAYVLEFGDQNELHMALGIFSTLVAPKVIKAVVNTILPACMRTDTVRTGMQLFDIGNTILSVFSSLALNVAFIIALMDDAPLLQSEKGNPYHCHSEAEDGHALLTDIDLGAVAADAREWPL